VAQAVKSEINLLDTVVNISQNRNSRVSSTITSFQSSLNSYLGTANSTLSSLLNQNSSLENAKNTIVNTGRDISVSKIGNPNGDDPISLQIARTNFAQKEQNLVDMEDQLADYTLRMPFAGTVAKVNVKKGDTVSSGTAVATVITKHKLASISLNEIDAARIKNGQKATLTFDAIDNLSITGEVISVDAIGTVSQGVVTYNVEINFDTDDVRVKPGMSVSAAIITDIKSNILMVSSSAIKTQGDVNYVEILSDALSTPPIQKVVTLGASNDTDTEIVSGLTEGDLVITRTIAATTATNSTSQAPSLLNSLRGATASDSPGVRDILNTEPGG